MVERFARGSKMLRVMMSIILDERLDGHSQIPCGNPGIDALLHQPCRCRVSQNVRGDFAMISRELRVEHSSVECLRDASYGASFVFDYRVTRYAEAMPTTHVYKQPRR